MPRDGARYLIEAMEHPLNHPHIDVNKKIVSEGYGLLQPRVSNSLSGARRSLFTLMHCREAGIDPYTRVVSDIYQDLFAEGSFIGKGIYHVDTFQAILHHRLPANRILSHDLLEGCYVRSGLISDVQLFEEYPSTYMADVGRRHRWIRGDWQIADWLLPWVPGGDQKSIINPLSLLSRFKIFDNLRRSITPLSVVAIIILSWTVFAGQHFWIYLALGVVFLPPLISCLAQLFLKPKEIGLQRHLADTFSTALVNLTQSLFSFACLPHEAYFSLDAILRTCYRMVISKKHMLVWQAASSPTAKKAAQANLWSRMFIGPMLSVSVLPLLLSQHRHMLPIAAPVLLLWFFAPAIASYISRPMPKPKSDLKRRSNHILK